MNVPMFMVNVVDAESVPAYEAAFWELAGERARTIRGYSARLGGDE